MKEKPLGKNMIDALCFATRWEGWHRFDHKERAWEPPKNPYYAR